VRHEHPVLQFGDVRAQKGQLEHRAALAAALQLRPAAQHVLQRAGLVMMMMMLCLLKEFSKEP
jgi:hypothetical protein